jgi:hypothetical protein
VTLKLLTVAIVLCGIAWEQQPDLVLRGTVTGVQNNTYIEVPFEVSAGISRLTVTFHYTGKEEHTTLDIGVEDPQGFRGWSGGAKSSFTISATDATPGYLPGRLPAGTWKLLIGVPNIRSQSASQYEANVFFSHARAPSEGFANEALRTAPGWYRGDLHMHTGHSDGHCSSQSGKLVSCPTFITVQTAADRGLDFVAVTDHNTTSHYDSLREVQPYFDRLLLIPGREITTFEGHANVFGTTQFVDFRVGSSAVPDMTSLLRQVQRMGALISINHPNAPSGEVCMGCGWLPKSSEMALVQAIEAVNGGAEEGPYSGVPFWEKQLTSGYHVTAIGGSDNHNPQLPPSKPGAVGSPTTVVYSAELSVEGVLNGIRQGRVFVDLTGSKDRLLDFSAVTPHSKAWMGQSIQSEPGESVTFMTHTVACQGSQLRILLDGQALPLSSADITSADHALTTNWTSDGKRHWLRADVVSNTGKLELLGNAIYVNFPAREANASQ